MNMGTPKKGPQTFQMLWDCKFCGTTKLLGVDDQHCPNCGSAQDPSWRYFPAETDIKFIENPKFAGADKACPFCSTPNSAEAKFCKSCGGDMSTAKEVAKKENLVTGLEGAAGKREDMALKQHQAEQAAIAAGKTAYDAKQFMGTQPKKKSKGLPIGCWIALVAVVVLIGGFLVVSNIKHTSSVTVTDMTWNHKIDVQQVQPQAGSNWQDSMPSDAYNVTCHSQDRCHTEQESYTCGYEYKDNGNGSGERQEKTCTRDKQVCVSDQMCNYTVDRWVTVNTLTTSGGVNDQPHCPAFTPLQGQRGTCEENYNVLFQADKKNYTYSQSNLNVWSSFKIGQKYNLDVNVLDQPSWDSLKLLSGQ
jgi:hypothetical protein